MSLNPDPSKQAQEVIFIIEKQKRIPSSSGAFNNNNVSETNSQKCLGVVFDNHFF